MILQRLNLDSSWAISSNSNTILVDPWLEGTEVDYFSWFNTQWHRTKPADYADVPSFDAILITQKYPDHFHPQTLHKLRPGCLIIPSSLEKRCRKEFPNAKLIVCTKSNPKAVIGDIQIDWLFTSRKIDPIYDAVHIQTPDSSVFIANHGFTLNSNDSERKADILITSFNHYVLPALLGGIISPGLDGVKALCSVLKPRKIIATHDEQKHAIGLVSKFAKVHWFKPVDLNQEPDLKDLFLDVNTYEPFNFS